MRLFAARLPQPPKKLIPGWQPQLIRATWWASPQTGLLYPPEWLEAYLVYAAVVLGLAAVGAVSIVMAIDEYINRWSGGMVTVMHNLSAELEMALRGLSRRWLLARGWGPPRRDWPPHAPDSHAHAR